MNRNWTLFILLILLSGCISGSKFSVETPPVETTLPATTTPAPVPQDMILATTTSTRDSGLLDVLLPPFESKNNVKVKVVAVGTGAAIEYGKRGDADVILVHARSAEDKFVADGYGVNRKDVMYNDYVVVGPANDPAGIKGMKNATEAFLKIYRGGFKFVSRGDNSGTHTKEKEIWNKTGMGTPSNKTNTWYVEAGAGMGDVLRMTNEMGAYTLADRGTYLALKSKYPLVVVVEGDKILFNPYGVIAVNPEKFSNRTIKFELANKFIGYITGTEGQAIIKDYGKDKYGEPLFYLYSQ